jgi:photosynthetic reaction center H subunit
MGTGHIVGSIDVAQLVLYLFWIFFAGLIYYLIRENHREGYPMDADRGVVEGWPPPPEPKTYKLANGHEMSSGKVAHPTADPSGNPLASGAGPGSWTPRSDTPDVDFEGHPKLVPLRAAAGCGVSGKDPDPRGMAVTGADGEVAGTVRDLWLDKSEMLFRYLEVATPGGRNVLVPMPFAKVTRRGVAVDALLAAQFAGVPGTKSPDVVTTLEEEKISAYFGAGTLWATPRRAEPML